MPATGTVTQVDAPSTPYSWTEPPVAAAAGHFSSLLFGGSVADTVLEITLLAAPFALVAARGDAAVNVPESMPLTELATFGVVTSILRRGYNAYLEAVWFTCPQHRTQGIRDHKLQKSATDLCGRELEQLRSLDYHNKLTAISQFVLNYFMYWALPAFYPAAAAGAYGPSNLHHNLISRGC